MEKILFFIKKNKWLIIGLVLLIIVMIILDNKNRRVEKEENIPTPTNTIFEGGKGPSKEEAEELTREQDQAMRDYPLWEKMPVEEAGYKISHYSAPLTIVVYIENDKDMLNVKIKVEKWISDNGGNVNEHQIEWRSFE